MWAAQTSASSTLVLLQVKCGYGITVSNDFTFLVAYSTEMPKQNCLTSYLQTDIARKKCPQRVPLTYRQTAWPNCTHSYQTWPTSWNFSSWQLISSWWPSPRSGLSDSYNFRHVPTRTTSILYVTIHKFLTFCGDESEILPYHLARRWTLD